MPSIVLSHPTGNPNVRAVAAGLTNAQLLAQFHTAIGTFPGDWLDRLSQLKVLTDIRRRRLDPALKPFTHLWPWREWGRMLALKTGQSFLTKHETGYFSVDAVYQAFDRHVAAGLEQAARTGARAVYAYEDGALETFKQAKRLGLTCIYDLPIAYWETGRRLLLEEADRLPTWAPTLAGGINDSDQKLARKARELELADLIVTPSQFVAASLPPLTAAQQVLLSPFGSPPRNDQPDVKPSTAQQPLRVLFAGSMGQRKGLGDLFAAINLLNRPDIELVVMGSPLAPMSFYRTGLPSFTYEPTRSHEQVLALMRSCDVFCLPSIVEGRALVMQEAMSQGLPLLITPNTGGSDLILEGETGFLLPIRSPEAIAQKLAWFLDNRSALPYMRASAQAHAATYTWNTYAATIVDTIRALLTAT